MRISFADADYPGAVRAYEVLARAYPGWTLTEIKELSTRERGHWLRRAMWEAERR